MRKLTNTQIIAVEAWVDSKKKQKSFGANTREESMLIAMVEKFRSNDWKGVRIKGNSTVEECKRSLEALKKKSFK